MNILVIHMGALGDVILSLPALQLIRHSCGTARIELLGTEPNLQLIAYDLDAAGVTSIDQARFAPLFLPGEPLSTELRQYLKGMDAIFVFSRNPDSALVDNLRKGFPDRLRVIPCLPPPEMIIHVTRYQLGALEHLGDGNRYLPARLQVPHEDVRPQRRLQRHLSDSSPGQAKRLVGIHPGSGSPKKCWPRERFDDLLRSLTTEDDAAFLLFLGPAEEEWDRSVPDVPGSARIRTIRNRPLHEVAQLLSLCRVYVGNDSGITHLAAALGVPTVAIFGPTDPRLWKPVGAQVTIVSPDTECAPCEREGRVDCEDRTCLKSIGVERMLKAVRTLV